MASAQAHSSAVIDLAGEVQNIISNTQSVSSRKVYAGKLVQLLVWLDSTDAVDQAAKSRLFSVEFQHVREGADSREPSGELKRQVVSVSVSGSVSVRQFVDKLVAYRSGACGAGERTRASVDRLAADQARRALRPSRFWAFRVLQSGTCTSRWMHLSLPRWIGSSGHSTRA